MTKKESAEAAAKEIREKAEALEKLKQEYKLKYGAIAHFSHVDNDGKERHLWLKSPSRMAVGIYLAQRRENLTSAVEAIFYDASIKEISDVEYFNQNALFNGMIAELQEIIEVKKSTFTTF